MELIICVYHIIWEPCVQIFRHLEWPRLVVCGLLLLLGIRVRPNCTEQPASTRSHCLRNKRSRRAQIGQERANVCAQAANIHFFLCDRAALFRNLLSLNSRFNMRTHLAQGERSTPTGITCQRLHAVRIVDAQVFARIACGAVVARFAYERTHTDARTHVFRLFGKSLDYLANTLRLMCHVCLWFFPVSLLCNRVL